MQTMVEAKYPHHGGIDPSSLFFWAFVAPITSNGLPNWLRTNKTMLDKMLAQFQRKGKLNQHAFDAMSNEDAVYDPEVFSQLLSPLKSRELSIELRAVLIDDSTGSSRYPALHTIHGSDADYLSKSLEDAMANEFLKVLRIRISLSQRIEKTRLLIWETCARRLLRLGQS